MTTAKKIELFDQIIIGGNLTGLLIARHLELAGFNVAIIDEGDEPGGALRPVSVKGMALETSLCLFPDSEEHRQLLAWLEPVLDASVIGESLELPPLTFDSGSLKPFVSFGDRKFHSLNILSNYNQTKFINLKIRPEQWIYLLTTSLTSTLFKRAVVTEIDPRKNGLQVTVNGAKKLYSRQAIFCLPAKQLTKLLKDDFLQGRIRQRIDKLKLWTSVHLHFLHSQVHQENQALHFLYGSRDDYEPTLGRFFAPVSEDNRQASLWMGFIQTELANNSEQIANTIREIKKQLRRTYPELLKDIIAEKIVVDTNSHGLVDLSLKEAGVLPQLPGLYLAHSTHWPQLPLPGALKGALEALAWLGQPHHPEPSPASLKPEIFW